MIIVERPPNFELILKAFPNADKPGVIFAYGPDIYNPSGGAIPPALVAHEQVHCARQLCGATYGEDLAVNSWWEKYIADAEFRYREELAAHVAEFKAQLFNGLIGGDRNWRAKLLQRTAARLCAPLYNYVPPRSLTAACIDLRTELDR